MTSQQLEKRRQVMKRSMALGHCICDIRQPCPCDIFKQKDLCPCAGERETETNGKTIRLTEHVRSAGCASKISKGVLKEVLGGLPEIDDPRVLVGSSAGDDAGVMLISKDTATILTVDVFSPSVDDPYTFGQIAAANSLSDVYAMGGTPQAALSIIGFPIHSLPASVMREILRGGIDKMKEAGVPIVGGHSINDDEVKCGFAVIGTSAPDGYVRNAGAQVGDVIVLTKPLGGGIAAFANQIGRIDPAAMQRVAESMASLNKSAGKLMVKYEAHAATDVTGFSLLGHMAEIVKNSQVRAEIDFDRIPVFDGVRELAQQDVLPGAIERNKESVEAALLDLKVLTPAQQAILYCPETSGGMLIFLPPDKADVLLGELYAAGAWAAAVIGKVTEQCPGGKIVGKTQRTRQWEPMALAKAEQRSKAVENNSCCGSAATSEAIKGEINKASCCCTEETPKPAAANGELPAPAAADAFKAYMGAVGAPGALGLKYNKLISLALSVMSKCEPCVNINAKAARDAGASEAEIAEAVSLGIAFGGAPVAMFYNTMRKG